MKACGAQGHFHVSVVQEPDFVPTLAEEGAFSGPCVVVSTCVSPGQAICRQKPKPIQRMRQVASQNEGQVAGDARAEFHRELPLSDPGVWPGLPEL